MASKPTPKRMNRPFTDTVPDWPTSAKQIYNSGLVISIDNDVWLYRRCPMGPVTSAITEDDALRVGQPIFDSLVEIEGLTRTAVKSRRFSKNNYREFHMLLVNVPQRYVPDDSQPLKGFLSRQFSDAISYRRELMVGVKLRNSAFRSGWRQSVNVMYEALTLQNVGVQLPEYEADYRRVDAALTRAGLMVATRQEMHLADSWWNLGANPDVPYLVHSDHLHMFTSTTSMTEAARLEKDGVDCREPDWSDLKNHHSLGFVSFDTFNYNWREVKSHETNFVVEMVRQGAMAVSFRGKVEPTPITRNELRTGRRRIRADITEAQAQGAMDRQEQEDKQAAIEQMESLYSSATLHLPTLIDASIVAALNGSLDGSYDVAGLTRTVKLSNMVERQEKALAEMMIGSKVRSNPSLRDLPATAMAFTGAPDLAVCGDATGALLGFTEHDKQPVYISNDAASVGDSLPIFLVAGATGSGKLLRLSETVPTPHGHKRIGELRVGDEVFGRNGKVTRVSYLSPINPTPDLYRVTFSDGQSVVADFDHQWVVSSFRDRHANNKSAHLTAIERWDERKALLGRIEAFADTHSGNDSLVTVDELAEFLAAHFGSDHPWSGTGSLTSSYDSVRAALVMMDAPFVTKTVTRTAKRSATTITKVDPVKVWPVADLLTACVVAWESVSGGNAVRWKGTTASRISAARAIIAAVDPGRFETVAEIARMLRAHGAVFPQSSKATLAAIGRAAGLVPTPDLREVTLPYTGQDHQRTRDLVALPLNTALKSLAARYAQQLHNRPATGFMEQRMTTGEMLAAGLKANGTHSSFAIRMPDAIELPDAELPIDPYVLGAWLGDGSTGSGQITSAAVESCTDEFGVSDQAHLLSQLTAVGLNASASPSVDKTINIRGFLPALRKAGVLNDKHIPVTYLRSSAAQRLAVLQGLMDTGGSIDVQGSCERTLCKRDLAYDALELIRSLGIKCSIRESEAAYISTDPETGAKSRTVTGVRYRMVFTTDQPVFRLPRKASRVPSTVRDTQKWLYITDIESVPTEPGRCLSVEHPDHTYLVGGFIPTSNTQTLLNIAYQWAEAEVPQCIIDPKAFSDHSVTVLAAGGQVATLDDLAKSDGILDPLRFTQNVQAGLEFAGSMLLQVAPWEKPAKQYETELMVALDYGVKEGATCIGQALTLARDAGKASDELVKPVLQLANVSALFSAIVGRDPQTKGLSVADGITLIMVGKANLELPPMGQPPSTLQQRIAVGLVRMMVFGSAMALTNRRGVLHFDEAWIATLAGPDELERLGRLARSQQVLPVLYTQRVTDVVKIGLSGYISRGLIMHLKDESEARAACELFKLEPTPERINRITAPERSGGGSSESKEGSLNWNSLKALFKPDPLDPEKRINVRGSVGIHIDLHGRAVPVVQDLPPEFLAMSSTSPDEIRRRTEKMQALEAARLAAAEAGDDVAEAAMEADDILVEDVFSLS